MVQERVTSGKSGVSRVLPIFVVLVVVGGFCALAWYAYDSGKSSLGNEELVVVEADHTPMREKPQDPGGMKFPNQDKTVFDTFSAGGDKQANVERVLPAPEEPMNPATADETESFVNGKDKALADSAKAELAGKPLESAKPEVVASNDLAAPAAKPELIKPVEAKPVPLELPAAEEAPAAAEPAKPVTAFEPPKKKAEEVKPEIKRIAKTEEKPKEAKKSSGSANVQLGSYRSEAEANGAWKKIKAQFSELADKSPSVQRADLGAKGVFYRLRVSGDAGLCAALSARGQACLVVK